MTIRPFRLLALLIAVFTLLLGVSVAQANSDAKGQRSFDQFIVKFAPGSTPHRNAAARQRLLDASGRAAGASVQQLRRLAVDADVVRTSRKLDFPGAQAFMNRLRRDPAIEYVEIDRRMYPAFTPNDPRYGNQWAYYEATGGINLPAAWDQSTGAGVVVAVLDTGITPHSDLNANIVSGYDFISSLTTAQDGNARDPDPNDPGDWAPAGACDPPNDGASNSTWHGTHVAGTVAAVTNNGVGVAGVAFSAKVMPLRVLGRCGGSTSDIADAIIWASGGTVAGIPTNANPVEAINLSLGGEGACGATTQSAINQAVAAGTVVVVAAGNSNLDASGFEPANCQNVIVVGANTRAGAKSSFSNFGPLVDVSAPGGGDTGIDSTINTGTSVPAAEGYRFYQGTSMATPHVAGTVALMQSALASSPAAVESVLKNTARSFPVPCDPGCGAGIINASSAIAGAVSGVLTLTDVTLPEGDVGPKNFTFTVNLSKPMATTVTFRITTAAGTAVAGSDFVGIDLANQSIAAGATSKSFNVQVVGDTSPEAAENFFVNVSSVVGIAVADGQGTGIILNDDPQPLANDVPVSGISGDAGQSFLYSLVVPAGQPSLSFDTTGGTGDMDMYVKFGSVPTRATADCVSEGATTVETCSFPSPAAGTYYVTLYAYTNVTSVTLNGKYASTALPAITLSDSVLSEGNSGTSNSAFTVTLSAPSATPVSFDIATIDGSAVAGSDYLSLNSPGQSIPAGSTSKTFWVSLKGDTAVERNEYYYVRLGNISGAAAADRVQGMGVIANDDYPVLSISPAAILEGNSGSSNAWFTIDLSAPSDSAVTVNVTTSDGSAVAGQDYQARSAPGLVIPAGQTRLAFAVQVLGDTTSEADETFNVTLSSPSSATLGNPTGIGTIVNDDAAGLAAKVTTSKTTTSARVRRPVAADRLR